MFLIQGGKGCGKHTIITSVTAALGLHLYKITSVDVCATSYSQVESKLRSLLFKIKLMAPCIFVIDNFEVSKVKLNSNVLLCLLKDSAFVHMVLLKITEFWKKS